MEAHGANIDWWKRRDNRPLIESIQPADCVFLAVPSPFLHESLAVLPKEAFHGKDVVSAIKGYIPETHESVSTYMQHHFDVSPDHLCVVGGPSHAEEVAVGQMAALTVASPNRALAQLICGLLHSSCMHCTPSSDMLRLERAATLKNIYAVAVGMCRGLGGGDNCTGMLMASILKESTRATKMDENAVADLLATCYSHHSRNFALGEMIGQGVDVRSALEQMPMTPEGYYAAQSFKEVCCGAHLPVAQTVCNILLGTSPTEEILHFD